METNKNNEIIINPSIKIDIYQSSGVPVKEIFTTGNFMINDILALLRANSINANIVHISKHINKSKYLLKEYFDIFKETCEYFKNQSKVMFDDETIICISAYADMDDYPEDEYFFNDQGTGDKELPVTDIIEEQLKYLEELGFVDINEYVNYEFGVDMVYGNSIGLKLINLSKNK